MELVFTYVGITVSMCNNMGPVLGHYWCLCLINLFLYNDQELGLFQISP